MQNAECKNSPTARRERTEYRCRMQVQNAKTRPIEVGEAKKKRASYRILQRMHNAGAEYIIPPKSALCVQRGSVWCRCSLCRLCAVCYMTQCSDTSNSGCGTARAKARSSVVQTRNRRHSSSLHAPGQSFIMLSARLPSQCPSLARKSQTDSPTLWAGCRLWAG